MSRDVGIIFLLLVSLLKERDRALQLAGIEVAQGQQDLRLIQVRVDLESLLEFLNGARIIAQRVKCEAEIGMAFNRSGVEIDNLLIDFLGAIELLISERGLALRQKFGQTGGLCRHSFLEG